MTDFLRVNISFDEQINQTYCRPQLLTQSCPALGPNNTSKEYQCRIWWKLTHDYIFHQASRQDVRLKCWPEFPQWMGNKEWRQTTGTCLQILYLSHIRLFSRKLRVKVLKFTKPLILTSKVPLCLKYSPNNAVDIKFLCNCLQWKFRIMLGKGSVLEYQNQHSIVPRWAFYTVS